jgi:hypothetical protein
LLDIAKDIEPTPLPPILTRNGTSYDRMAAPMAFSEYFKSKISVIEESMTIDEDIWNGKKIITSECFNFMTPDRSKKFKIKKLQGPRQNAFTNPERWRIGTLKTTISFVLQNL